MWTIFLLYNNYSNYGWGCDIYVILSQGVTRGDVHGVVWATDI